MLLWIGFRCRIDRAFAFGHTYALFLQPLRLVKRVPLVLFLRGDTLEKHRTTGRSNLLIHFERCLEGFGIAGTRMYGVSATLVKRISERHQVLRPSICGVLRNDVPTGSAPALDKEITLPLRTACVGILEHGKNQQLLLDVFKGISAEQAQLYLYGTGPDEQLLRERATRENLTDRVQFMGWVPSERIWPEVDLLLMPSLHEGAPNAVLEALGYGIPVFASDIPEHGEILPEQSLLPIDDVARWRSRILFFVNEPEVRLREFIEKQRTAAEALWFDWEKKFVELIV
ncbi:glycosyltransferase family 4 protein [Candidatus Electronema sp. JM]|uniref:glycosyltransferase family 4 protein n=1 Tax=Candidatus Electronema sp. JM TaxID=3401571 RepID=UPI003AA7C3A8